MATPAEIQMLRNADPGVVLPGIDTTLGAPPPTLTLSSITTNSSAPIWYQASTNTVIVKQANADLNGYNFGTATVAIEANGVTVENCTFSGTTGDWALRQFSGYSGATVKNNTFIGGAGTHDAFIGSLTNITITGNEFVAAAGDAVDVNNGTISNNYFLGGGYSTTIHSDAIWVTNSSGPVSITGNLIDWTYNVTSGNGTANNAVRITTEKGSVSNVTVANNYLLGGSWTVDAGNSVNSGYTYSNITIDNNYLGFGLFGAFYKGPQSGVTESGNVIFDFTNPIYSQQAWAAYAYPAGVLTIPTTYLVASDGTSSITGNATGTTTLYGDGGQNVHMSGTVNETNFVGGAYGQSMLGGAGANIFTYLAISDSRYGAADGIGNFDPAKDVIDLSHIDADITTAGLQNFKFIGTATFSSAGGEARYYLDPANNATWVQADLVGDSYPDLIIKLNGLVTLTAANFALTPSQSTADLANGAALTVTRTNASSGSAVQYSYGNVQGSGYSSFQAYYVGASNREADNLNLSSTANDLVLYKSGLTVARGSSETLQIPTSTGASTFSLGYHSTETIDAGATSGEIFKFSSGFGSETVNGFALGGSNPDTIQLSTSAFSYLTSGMTQAQELSTVIGNATNTLVGAVISDSAGDKLLLTGLTTSAILANASQFQFV